MESWAVLFHNLNLMVCVLKALSFISQYIYIYHQSKLRAFQLHHMNFGWEMRQLMKCIRNDHHYWKPITLVCNHSCYWKCIHQIILILVKLQRYGMYIPKLGLWAWKHKFQYAEVFHDVLFLCKHLIYLKLFKPDIYRLKDIVIMKVTLLLIWCWWVKSDMGFL